MAVLGIDEVNFSPSLAADCVVCALGALSKVEGVRDSKKLSSNKKIDLFGKLMSASVYAVVPATVNMINHQGIYLARNNAMILAGKSAIDYIKPHGIKIDKVVIDGKWSKKWIDIFEKSWGVPVEPIVAADDKVYEVSAASIIARVYCDALFAGWSEFWPGYGMGKDHGSPSKEHYDRIRKVGPSPIHRTVGYGEEWWRKIMANEL